MRYSGILRAKKMVKKDAQRLTDEPNASQQKL